MVTAVPAVPDVGDRLLMTGVAAMQEILEYSTDM